MCLATVYVEKNREKEEVMQDVAWIRPQGGGLQLISFMGESRLFQAIQEFNGNHDYVVIDCPPSIGHLCFNALRACEEVIIPIDMSLFSLRGVAKLIEIVVLLKDECGHVIRSRALVTMYDFRTRYSKRVLENVKEQFGEVIHCFECIGYKVFLIFFWETWEGAAHYY